MPRYEFAEGNSNKFWQIELDGSSFTTTYGRIGTEGQSSLKEYDSPEKAKREYDKLIAEKVKKGYVLAAPPKPQPMHDAPKTLPSIPAAPVRLSKVGAGATARTMASLFEDEGEDDDRDHERDEKERANEGADDEKPKRADKKGGGGAKKTEVRNGGSPAAATPSPGKTSGARHFEYVEGASSKFWEISLDGQSFTTRYGRLGTEGQMSMKEYDSPEKARKEYEKLVADKVKKGYVEK